MTEIVTDRVTFTVVNRIDIWVRQHTSRLVGGQLGAIYELTKLQLFQILVEQRPMEEHSRDLSGNIHFDLGWLLNKVQCRSIEKSQNVLGSL